MSDFTRTLFFRALLLGFATGLRTMTAGAALAWHHDDAPRSAGWRTWPVLRGVWGRKLMVAASAGEIVGDKLPATPSRLQLAPLGGRIAFGALAGAALGTEGRGKAVVIRSAIVGGVGGAAGSYAGYHARKAAVDVTGLPDPAVAVVEDAIAVGLASTAVRNR